MERITKKKLERKGKISGEKHAAQNCIPHPLHLFLQIIKQSVHILEYRHIDIPGVGIVESIVVGIGGYYGFI